MNTWILIIISAYTMSRGDAVDIHSVEFNSRESCVFASGQVMKVNNGMAFPAIKRVICVKK